MKENKYLTILCAMTASVLLLNYFVFRMSYKTVTQAFIILAIFSINSLVAGACGWIGGRRSLPLSSSIALALLLLSWWFVWGHIWLKGKVFSAGLLQILKDKHVEFIIIYSLANTICFFFCFTLGEEQVLDKQSPPDDEQDNEG